MSLTPSNYLRKTKHSHTSGTSRAVSSVISTAQRSSQPDWNAVQTNRSVPSCPSFPLTQMSCVPCHMRHYSVIPAVSPESRFPTSERKAACPLVSDTALFQSESRGKIPLWWCSIFQLWILQPKSLLHVVVSHLLQYFAIYFLLSGKISLVKN